MRAAIRGRRLWPELILVGKNEAKLRALGERHGLTRYTTSLDEALAEPDVEVYDDAHLHDKSMRTAMAAGIHVYSENRAEQLGGALDLARAAQSMWSRCHSQVRRWARNDSRR